MSGKVEDSIHKFFWKDQNSLENGLTDSPITVNNGQIIKIMRALNGEVKPPDNFNQYAYTIAGLGVNGGIFVIFPDRHVEYIEAGKTTKISSFTIYGE